MSDPLLEIEDVTVRYETSEGDLTAVSDANLTVEEGEFYGLAGESGSGKSTVAKAVIGGLDGNGEIVSGKIKYRGEEIQDYSERELNEEIRWKEISYIPQSSMNNLDPLQRIDEQAIEIAQTHTELSEEEALQRFRDIFEVVGIQESRIDDYPHEFSGGMQQRSIIALALFLNPSLVIADEPTTALDVIMQDQILKYLIEVREEFDTSALFITHDMSVIFETCDKISIMHGGQVAESGTVEDLHDSPRHPYTLLFQNAFPDIREPKQELEIIEGHPPEFYGDVDECSFADRCPWAVDDCRAQAPPLEQIDEDNLDHRAACIRKEEVYKKYRRGEYDMSDTQAKGGSTSEGKTDD